MSWQPISEAPKDRIILVWNGYWGTYTSQYWEEKHDDGTLIWSGFPLGFCQAGFGRWYPVASYWKEREEFQLPLPNHQGQG